MNAVCRAWRARPAPAASRRSSGCSSPRPTRCAKRCARLEPDGMTPLEALVELDRLKRLLGGAR